ncbi:MAG TPA: glycoside hydrolase family 36 protein, partial [Spirochaetia bacterium]|nr:glycoside hydrolase family 36 protein [Spirochaetia bacterium]
MEQRSSKRIPWDQVPILPSVQLKFGIKRQIFPLKREESKARGHLEYHNEYIVLKGRWDNEPGIGSLFSSNLTNISASSIRITRLVFPTENGLNDFIRDFDPNKISFLRNGYQSWSTARSYRVKEKPLRPWLSLVSLASSNMANLPSNTAGFLSSEMYSLICNLKTEETFLVGQSAPFNQFFYIRLNLFQKLTRMSHFELVYDFGRKLIEPGETVELDGIIMAKGELASLQESYFSYLNRRMKIKVPKKNVTGWSSWYYYFNKIAPADILSNVQAIRERDISIDFIQIDDGYQRKVGDWLSLNPDFENKMRFMADSIRSSGFEPGIWIAPFVAEKGSELANNHPEYILRDEYGKPIVAGYSVFWHSHWYYGLDITNPRFEEYLRHVIKTIVQEWGFTYLKCDFLFGGCLRGGTHHNLNLTRAEVLKYGMNVIRQEAGKKAFIVGCGMPLSTGIGTVDAMRVGPDTGPYWIQLTGALLHTGAMVGVRNSIRNFIVRSGMHKYLWLNDPDCLMIRRKGTHLSKHERYSQINSIILSGGLLLYSDNFKTLPEDLFDQIDRINSINRECFAGRATPIDLMEREIPELYYNSSGYLGVFNFSNRKKNKHLDLQRFEPLMGKVGKLVDVWSEEEFYPDRMGTLSFQELHS